MLYSMKFSIKLIKKWMVSFLKKYEGKSNVIGNLINEYRTNLGLSKDEVCRKLQLHAVDLNRTELNRIETGRMIVKDFELIALCKVLNINSEIGRAHV